MCHSIGWCYSKNIQNNDKKEKKNCIQEIQELFGRQETGEDSRIFHRYDRQIQETEKTKKSSLVYTCIDGLSCNYFIS